MAVNYTAQGTTAPAFNLNPYNLTTDPLQGGGTYGEGKIGDANTRIKALTDALTSGQIDYATYQQAFNQFDPTALQAGNNITTQGSKAANAAQSAGLGQLQTSSQLGGTDLSQFASKLKSLTGQDPTATDMQNYFSNIGQQITGAPGGASTMTPTAVGTLEDSYLQNAYAPQIKSYQNQQATNTTDQALAQGDALVKSEDANLQQQLSDPAYLQKVMGSLNQTGMASSGAFETTLADQLSQGALTNENNMLQGIGLPAISGQVTQQNQPYNNWVANQNSNSQQLGQNQQQINLANLTNAQMQQLQQQMNQTSTWQDISPIIGNTIGAIGSAIGKK